MTNAEAWLDSGLLLEMGADDSSSSGEDTAAEWRAALQSRAPGTGCAAHFRMEAAEWKPPAHSFPDKSIMKEATNQRLSLGSDATYFSDSTVAPGSARETATDGSENESPWGCSVQPDAGRWNMGQRVLSEAGSRVPSTPLKDASCRLPPQSHQHTATQACGFDVHATGLLATQPSTPGGQLCTPLMTQAWGCPEALACPPTVEHSPHMEPYSRSLSWQAPTELEWGPLQVDHDAPQHYPGACDKPLKVHMLGYECEVPVLDPRFPAKKCLPPWSF